MRLYREGASNYLQTIYDLTVLGSLSLYLLNYSHTLTQGYWGLDRTHKVNHFPLCSSKSSGRLSSNLLQNFTCNSQTLLKKILLSLQFSFEILLHGENIAFLPFKRFTLQISSKEKNYIISLQM